MRKAALRCHPATNVAPASWLCMRQIHSFECKTPPHAGFLYPPGDYEAATAYVRKLVEDTKLRAQMGREARLEVHWRNKFAHVAHQLQPTA
jgi:hypothetical protein